MKHSILLIFILLLSTSLTYPIDAQEPNLATIPETSVAEAEVTNLEAINTSHVEYTPFITPDERFLFFESNRPGGVGETGDFDIWFSLNSAPEGAPPNFGVPVNPGKPLNSASFDGLPSLRLLPDGLYEIYFTSFAGETRPGPSETNIYYSRQKPGGGWEVPVPVMEINTDFHDRMPSISPDGNFLFFSSNRPGGFGKDDIWVSEYDHVTKKWGKPVNLGANINTAASEVSPSIHSDGITFYFSSDRRGGVGGYDIYFSQIIQTIKGKTMRKAQNIGKPYNSPQDDEYPTVVRSGEFLYFASNRAGGKGNFDVYRARVPSFAKPQVVITLKGRVHEEVSLKGIEANIRIDSIEGPRNISTGLPDGNYSLDFINKRQYKLTVTAPGYEPLEYELDLRNIHLPTVLAKNFPLKAELLLPDQFYVDILFRDSTSGANLKPQATYRLLPDNFQEQILPIKGNTGELVIAAMAAHRSVQDFVAYVKNTQLELKAQLAGYQPYVRQVPLADIINIEQRPMPRRFTLAAPMEPAQTTQKETPTEKSKPEKDKKEGKITVVLGGEGDILATVYFELNIGNKLNEEDMAKLRKLAETVKQTKAAGLILHGHTDSTGTRARNIVLSRERALFVKEKLAEAGYPRELIQPNWHANDRPAVAEKDEASRAKNRRVEIKLAKSPLKSPPEATKKEPNTEENTITPKPTSPEGE